MQVNQTTSPNFGQLKVLKDPRTIEALKKETPETLKKIKDAGVKLKQTQFYNVIVRDGDNGLECFMESTKDAYFGLFKSDKFKDVKKGNDDNIIIIDSKYGVAQYPRENSAIYNMWGSFGSYNKPMSIGAITEVALELDNFAIAQYNAKLATERAKQQYQQEVNGLVDDIIKDLGCD